MFCMFNHDTVLFRYTEEKSNTFNIVASVKVFPKKELYNNRIKQFDMRTLHLGLRIHFMMMLKCGQACQQVKMLHRDP